MRKMLKVTIAPMVALMALMALVVFVVVLVVLVVVLVALVALVVAPALVMELATPNSNKFVLENRDVGATIAHCLYCKTCHTLYGYNTPEVT